MLKIGDFSKLSRVSIRMLRHYDAIGLLMPASIDPYTGYRHYGEDQLPVVGRIQSFKDMGFSLAAIAEMLKCYDDVERIDEYLKVRQAELEESAEETAMRLKLIKTARERLRKENNMEHNVVLKTFPERYVASVRMVIPSYEDEGRVWSVLMSETAPLKLVDSEPCYCSVIFHDKEFKEADVDVEAQKTVDGRYPDTDHVCFKTEPPVTVASATFKGSYALMNEAYAAVTAWIDANGYEMDGPMFNIYHISPHETANPDEFVTEVCYPVARR